MTIKYVSDSKDPHSADYFSDSTSDDEIGGSSTDPDMDDNAGEVAQKAGLYPGADTNEKVGIGEQLNKAENLRHGIKGTVD